MRRRMGIRLGQSRAAAGPAPAPGALVPYRRGHRRSPRRCGSRVLAQPAPNQLTSHPKRCGGVGVRGSLKEALSLFHARLACVSDLPENRGRGWGQMRYVFRRSRRSRLRWVSASALRPRSASSSLAITPTATASTAAWPAARTAEPPWRPPTAARATICRSPSFRRIDRDEITGAMPTTTGTAARNEFVAIECLR